MGVIEMRTINNIILHCSASDNDQHDNVASIKRWHAEENGWSDIGYHFIITKAGNGKVHWCRPIEKKGAHCVNYNSYSIGICLTGNKIFSDAQMESAVKLVKMFMTIFYLSKTEILGHCAVSSKTCPNFNMDEFKSKLGDV